MSTALVKFQLRTDTAANWSYVNPVLLAGEPGHETDTGKLKVGDGVRNWAELPYSSGVSLASLAPPVAGTASAGVASTAARSDHTHALPSLLAPSALNVSSNASVGGNLTVSGQLFGAAHTHLASAVTDLNEAVEDVVASMLVAGPNMQVVHDDTANKITITALGGASVVTSVNQMSGDVTLTPVDIGAAAAAHTHAVTTLDGFPAPTADGRVLASEASGLAWQAIVMSDISDVAIASPGSPAVTYDVALTYNYATQAWAAQAIGRAGVGVQPIGGWPAGSLGAALASKQAAGNYATLVDGTVPLSQLPDEITATFQVSTSDRLLGRFSSGAGPAEEILCTAFARALLGEIDAASARARLGLAALATLAPTGTADATTFLRGDGVWATIPTSNGGDSTSFTTNPQSVTVTSGSEATFTAVAQSTETPIVYRWQRLNTIWEDIPGAASTTLTITPTLSDDGAQFRCVATTSNFGSAFSSAATLTVQPIGDGSAWRASDDGASAPYLGTYPIPYQEGLFVLSDYNSSDGSSWSASPGGTGGSQVLYGNGFFLALPPSGTLAYIKTSFGGVNWSPYGSYIGGLEQGDTYYPGAFGNGEFVFAGEGLNISAMLARTTNGQNYSRITNNPAYSNPTLPASMWFDTVFFANNIWIARNNYSTAGTVYWSTDNFASATASNLSISTSTTSVRHAYGAGLHVLMMPGNQAATSADGKSWTWRTLPVTGDWRGLAFGNGRFMTVGHNSTTVLTSTDGISWTVLNTLPAANAWDNINFGAGRFVISSNSANEHKVVISE